MIDQTHDPATRSLLEAANAGGCDFPIQNLPFAVLRRAGSEEPWRGGVAIGDRILDLAALARIGPLEDGDSIELSGWCEGDGLARIGLGSNVGLVRAAFP